MDINTNSGDGSIKSSFQFLNYKIDLIQFNVSKNAKSLLYKNAQGSNFEMGLNIRDVTKFLGDNKNICYMSGITIEIEIKDAEIGSIATGLFGKEGIFRLIGSVDEETEKIIVTKQFPTVLLPYLRSAVTNILASAGFGSVIFPLINIYNLAEQQEKRREIKIIES